MDITYNPGSFDETLWRSSREKTAQGTHNDIILNVSLQEALVRAIIALIGPIILFLINKHLMLIIVPVIAYIYVTAMMRYCVVKYLWRRYVRHLPRIKRKPYGLDINYPEESIPTNLYPKKILT